MKTCRDVITSALKKLGVLRSGGEASAADASDALASLQSFYMEGISSGMFGRVPNVVVNVEGTRTASPNQHVNVTIDETVTIDLPTTVAWDYWCCVNPVGDYGWPLNECEYYGDGFDSGQRVPRDKSVVMVTDQFGEGRATYIYDGTIQRWMRIDTLELTDEAPLSARGFDGLSALLATRIADDYGSTTLSPLTMTAANKYKLALVTNFGNEDDRGC